MVPVWQPVRPSTPLVARASAAPLRAQAEPGRSTEQPAQRPGQVRPASSEAPPGAEAPVARPSPFDGGLPPEGPHLLVPNQAVQPKLRARQGIVLGGEPALVEEDGLAYPVYSYQPGSGFLDGGGPLAGEGPWPPAGNLLVFAGVHGFKGPTDVDLGGNFGFHEGLNWGAPLGDPWGHGYQVGFQALQSNFVGTRTIAANPLPDFNPADRHQVFLTAGLFHRPLADGWQTGVVFDLFYDNYYPQSMLYQLRSETALVLRGQHEIGYWGAYGISKKTVTGLGQFDSVLAPTDIFAVFYRRRFTGGGRGRLWAGISGSGDVIFGLDGTIPLGTSWALDNNFTCLFPKHGSSSGGPPQESWSVSIHLVWYPGQSAHAALASPYHPLFYVADNSWFLVDRRN